MYAAAQQQSAPTAAFPLWEQGELSSADKDIGFDADMALFAVHFGFVTMFAPVSPTLPLLAFGLGLVLVRATLFRLLFVQRVRIAIL